MVAKQKKVQFSVAKGEWSSSLADVSQLAGYYEAASLLLNGWITGTGAFAKRYGMRSILTIPEGGSITKIDFTNSRGTRFLIVVTTGTIRIINADTNALLQTISADILTSDIVARLGYCSYQDSVILTENGLPTQQLACISDTNFQLRPVTFATIPTYEFVVNDSEPNAKLTPSARTGFITITASSSVFLSTDVGAKIELDPVGRFSIRKVNSGNSVYGFLEENLFDTTPVPAGNWTLERGWSALWGNGKYPACSGFQEGRLILANFPGARPVWAFSMVSAPFDFETGDGSLAYGGVRQVSEDQSDAILHVHATNQLFFFTENNEFSVDRTIANLDIHTAAIKKDANMGVVPSIKPMEAEGTGVLYFHPNNTGASEFKYYFERNSNESDSFSKFAQHLFNDPISGALWTGDNKFNANILFFVNADGSCVSATLRLSEKIYAFSRMQSDLPFRAVQTVGENVFFTMENEDGSYDLRCMTPGIYDDNGVAYETRIETMKMNEGNSSFFMQDITTCNTFVGVQEATKVYINGKLTYNGAPYTGRIQQFSPSGWESGGQISISDGATVAPWQVNVIGRVALIGGY